MAELKDCDRIPGGYFRIRKDGSSFIMWHRGVEIIEDTQMARDEFGHSYGSEIRFITNEQIQELLNGKMIAFSNGEYTIFMHIDIDRRPENER